MHDNVRCLMNVCMIACSVLARLYCSPVGAYSSSSHTLLQSCIFVVLLHGNVYKCRCSSGTVSDQHAVSDSLTSVLLSSNNISMDIQEDHTNASSSNSDCGYDSWFLYRVAQEAIVHG
jgi:hypothetical protein